MSSVMSYRETELRKFQTVTRAVVVVGITVSIGTNVLGSTNWIARGISAWPPLALLLALDLLTRIPARSTFGRLVRGAAAFVVAGGAAYLSYFRMVDTIVKYEVFDHGGQWIWPGTVDGLMVIAAVAMVDLGAMIREIVSKRWEREEASAEINFAVQGAIPVSPPPAGLAIVAPAIAQQPEGANEENEVPERTERDNRTRGYRVGADRRRKA